MKEKLLIIGLSIVFFAVSVEAQVAVNTDGSTPSSGAILDVKSTNMGLLPPRMSSTQRDMISSPPEGLMIYNTTTKGVEFYNGTYWINYNEGPPPETNLCGSTQTYGTIAAAGIVWLDRDLGAIRAATSSNDYLAYGTLFQWGRLSDGHECINWTGPSSGVAVNGVTGTQSTTDVPGHSLFIANAIDWRNPQNNNLWQGKYGINNPCPQDFRIPTLTELNSLLNSFSPSNSTGAFNSPVKMVVSGYRIYNNGGVNSVGNTGYLWSSTVNSTDAECLYFYVSGASIGNVQRPNGFSVRCVED